jgi:ATP-dependent exoDNAse (exonuclease V) beta subunit
LPNLELGYRSFDDLSRLLENAQIEYSPSFAAPESNDRFLAELEKTTETESRRLLYVAITRARDKLVLEWPGYQAGKNGQTYWSILAEEVGLSLEEDALKIGEASFPSIVTEGGSELPADFESNEVTQVKHLPTTGRPAIRPGVVPDKLTPDSVTPSGMKCMDSKATRVDLVVERYGDGLDPEVELAGMEMGTFLHRCFEVLGENSELAHRLSVITGIDVSERAANSISRSVMGFERWLKQRFATSSVEREIPLLALDEKGSVVSGTADLVVQTGGGAWIIDHKSDQVDDPEEAFKGYTYQLDSYAKLLAANGVNVLGTGINWIRRGEVVLQVSTTSRSG